MFFIKHLYILLETYRPQEDTGFTHQIKLIGAKSRLRVLTLTSALTRNDALPEIQTTGFTGWNYYDSSVVSTTAPGDYAVWIILTDASGDKAFKKSTGKVIISHRPNIQIDVPMVGISTTAPNKFITVEWTDVDYDQSAKVDLFYSTTDLVGGGTGGALSASQVIQAATSRRLRQPLSAKIPMSQTIAT